MGRSIRWLLAAVVAGAGLYYWLFIDNRMPADAHYGLDLADIRQLADSLPGDKPSQVRYEKVMAFSFPGAAVVSGDSWRGTDMSVYAYQLVYPDHTVVIDTAMDRSIAKPDFMVPFYDDDAYARVQQAMDRAAMILITHEHMDHIGGLAQHPRLAALLPATRLTDIQLANTDRMKPAKLPLDLFKDYQPLRYQGLQAIAPGVVLIAAPGHTPGSQMVYVRQADGQELLFLGDVSWHARNIETQRERPRFVTALLIREDRPAVFGQLQTLQQLAQQHPKLLQIPGHDAGVIAALTLSGALQAGFLP